MIDFKKDSFWYSSYPEGATEKDILNELKDFEFLIGEAQVVYHEVTGCMVSKVNTKAFEVIGMYNEHMDKIVQEAVDDSYPELQATIKEQGELIGELKQGAVDLVRALHAYGSNGDEYNTALRDMGKLLAKQGEK